MLRKTRTCSLFIALSVALTARTGAAATILAGVEDAPGSSGMEHNGDFNDLMFKITGNISFNSPGGVFGNLTSAVVNETGTVFWDQPSGDGANQNVGFYMPGFGATQYLATSNGGSVNDVTFLAQGGLTITILGGITANLQANTVGWYDPSHPGVLHQLFLGAGAGATATFTPTAQFALYSTNGVGQFYSSESFANTGESTTQQHFAFFEQTTTVTETFEQTAAVPEPSSVFLTGIGAGLLTLVSGWRRRRNFLRAQ